MHEVMYQKLLCGVSQKSAITPDFSEMSGTVRDRGVRQLWDLHGHVLPFAPGAVPSGSQGLHPPHGIDDWSHSSSQSNGV